MDSYVLWSCNLTSFIKEEALFRYISMITKEMRHLYISVL